MTLVLCTWGEASRTGIREALTLARRIAAARGLALHWLIAGAPPAGESAGEPAGEVAGEVATLAARYGVASLDFIEDPALASPGPDALVEALAQYCAQAGPCCILIAQNASARLIAPRLAGRLDVPVVMNAFDAVPAGEALEVMATAFGGDTHVVYQLAPSLCVLSLVTSAVVAQPAERATQPRKRRIAVDLAAVEERFKVSSAPQAEGPRLEDAEIIVAGGRGLGNAANFGLVKDLAAALGGMWGGSRAIVDEGWIDSSRQVGLTGKITRPSLYLAAGISGASQHMAGCSAAGTIVAINRDADASIFRYARYGIVGDCLQVLPELIKAAKP